MDNSAIKVNLLSKIHVMSLFLVFDINADNNFKWDGVSVLYVVNSLEIDLQRSKKQK